MAEICSIYAQSAIKLLQTPFWSLPLKFTVRFVFKILLKFYQLNTTNFASIVPFFSANKVCNKICSPYIWLSRYIQFIKPFGYYHILALSKRLNLQAELECVAHNCNCSDLVLFSQERNTRITLYAVDTDCILLIKIERTRVRFILSLISNSCEQE